jgi:hypothetical protein
MKNINIINDVEREFLSSLTNQSVMCGSIFTRLEVAEIIKAYTNKLKESVIEDTPTQSAVTEEKIREIGRLALNYAHTYVGNCIDNYDFDDAVEMDTNDYGNEVRISANIRVDDTDFMNAGEFNLDSFQDELTEIINRQDEQIIKEQDEQN